MKRVRDITAATLNDRLEKSEDPVRLIDQYLVEQRRYIQEAEQLLRQCMQHAESMKRQYLTAAELADRREQQAATAVKAGEEQLARLALQEKMQNEEKREQYKELYEKAKLSLMDLEDQLDQLRTEYDEVLSKRQYYAARMESLRLQQRMNERMRQTGTVGSDQAFRRLEDKVSTLEWETKTLGEVRRLTQETFQRTGTAIRNTLEIELEQLKQRLEKEGWIRK